MKEVDNSTVIDFTDNPKNAALYFDFVIPFSDRLPEDEDVLKYWGKLVPKGIRCEECSRKLNKIFYEFYKENSKDGSWMNFALAFCLTGGSKVECPIVYPPNKSYASLGQTYDTVMVKLSKLCMVDVSKASWEQIIEFRQDNKSVSQLRKLKTHFYENYSGKEKNYIEDDLMNRIEEYNNIVKDWGFETVTSSLTLLNTSITSVGSSLVLALTGQPLEVAAASGICVGIGNVALHLAKEKHKLMKLGRDHPLAFIIDAKKILEKQEK